MRQDGDETRGAHGAIVEGEDREAGPEDRVGDVLLTGFPDYVAERIGRQILAAWPSVRLLVLQRDCDAAWGAFVDSLEAEVRARVMPLSGHVAAMDLGLDAATYGDLRRRLRWIVHAASAYRGDGGSSGLRRVNVDGTREVLELAAQCGGLERFVYLSTVRVSGCREGVVLEEELEAHQRFCSPYEQTRYEAERAVRRASRTLPVTVLRPGIVVGDSRTGEIRPYEGPWDLLERLLFPPRGQGMLLPGSGQAPVHLVPVDHVARAAVHLAALPEAQGGTFHVVDPSPLPGHKVLEWLARKARRRAVARRLPRFVSRAVRVHRRVAQLSPFPLAPPEIFDQMVFYNAQHALTALEPAGIRCPPLPTYVEALVAAMQRRRAPSGPAERQPTDPLDPGGARLG